MQPWQSRCLPELQGLQHEQERQLEAVGGLTALGRWHLQRLRWWLQQHDKRYNAGNADHAVGRQQHALDTAPAQRQHRSGCNDLRAHAGSLFGAVSDWCQDRHLRLQRQRFLGPDTAHEERCHGPHASHECAERRHHHALARHAGARSGRRRPASGGGCRKHLAHGQLYRQEQRRHVLVPPAHAPDDAKAAHAGCRWLHHCSGRCRVGTQAAPNLWHGRHPADPDESALHHHQWRGQPVSVHAHGVWRLCADQRRDGRTGDAAQATGALAHPER